jgi:Ca2+-binding EF-hand superfamily protein
MAFSLLRIGNRLSCLGLTEKALNGAIAVAATSLSQQSVMKFTSSPVVCSSKKSFVEQAREFSKHTEPKRAYQSDSDSDSDNERRVRGESAFWRKKMRTLHGVLDVDNNGVISYDDFVVLADKFGDLGHLSKEEVDEFRQTLRETWEKQWGEVTPYNLVTMEQYLADMKHVVNDKDLRKKCHRFLPFVFKAIDKDHSGEISIEEFKLFFRCLGLTEEDAAVSFAIIDINGDGKLSMKEFVKLGRDFFLNENEKAASRMFWGPLADH